MDGVERVIGVDNDEDINHSNDANDSKRNEWWRDKNERTPLLSQTSPSTSSSNRPYPIKTWSAGQSKHFVGTGPLTGLPQTRTRPSSLYLHSPWQDHTSPYSRSAAINRRKGIENLFHKSPDYDDISPNASPQDQALLGTGYRIWSQSYSTIDWIHDLIKDRVRLRQLRSQKGLYGFFVNNFDAAQAWILVFLIAIVCGLVASLIDIGQQWLTDIKSGFCSYSLFYSKHTCCGFDVVSHSGCDTWIGWNDLKKSPFPNSNLFIWSYIFYVGTGMVMATIAALLVRVTADTREIEAEEEEKSGRVPSHETSTNVDSTSRPHKIIFHAAGSGIPEVKTILSGFVIRGFLGFRTLAVKSIGLMLSVSSGLSVGKEGPTVHIACCIGNVLSRFFNKYARNEGKRREILSSSAAAGVAVAFGSPIGGVLFSLEEVSYYFPSKTLWRALFCALISTVTVKFVNPIGNYKVTMFEVSYNTMWYFFEIPFFIMLGIICGLYGSLFIKCNMWWQRLRATSFLKNHPVKEVLVIALITGLINYMNVFTRVGSAHFVGQLFAQCEENNPGLGNLCSMQEMGAVTWSLIQCLVVKAVLTVVTFGCKIPAGIFIPNMFVGACVGRLVGMGLLLWHSNYPHHTLFAECPAGGSCITPGVYALVGAAAALSGVTRMTISLTVIMMEITGTLTHSVPIMVSVLTAKWIADAFGRESIYDCIIELNNHPFLETKQELLVQDSISTAHVMDPVINTIDVDRMYMIEELEEKLDSLYQTTYGSDGGFPLVQGDNVLVGWIHCAELGHALGEARQSSHHQAIHFRKIPTSSAASSSIQSRPSILTSVNVFNGQPLLPEEGLDFGKWCNWSPLTVPLSASMDLVVEIFVKLGVKVLLITKAAGGQVCGVLHKKKLIHYLKSS